MNTIKSHQHLINVHDGWQNQPQALIVSCLTVNSKQSHPSETPKKGPEVADNQKTLDLAIVC